MPDLLGGAGTDPGSTTRLPRALTALELVTETGPGTFRLTDAGALLRTDRVDSMAALTRVSSDPAVLAARARLDDAVRTGGGAGSLPAEVPAAHPGVRSPRSARCRHPPRSRCWKPRRQRPDRITPRRRARMRP